MNHYRVLLWFTVMVAGVVVGCNSNQSGSPFDEDTRPAVATRDDSLPRPEQPVDRTDRYTVDAMIGQVNGRALYANRVLEPINEQLMRLGEQLTRDEFRRRAEQLVVGRMQEILFDSLILGEAERDLTDQERSGLDMMMASERKEYLRRYGQGSAALADENMRKETGKGLEKTLEDRRKQVLTTIFFQRKLSHKLNVTRKDVERYYRDHYDEFNSADKRTLRLIQVSDVQAAEEIEKQLADGESFLVVVKHPANSRWADRVYEVVGDKHFGERLDALNLAMVDLEQGQYSPKMEIDGVWWWVYVETYEPGEGKSLQDVQLDIEAFLQEMQWRKLTQDYRSQLIAEQDLSEIARMSQRLLEIVMNRYARQ